MSPVVTASTRARAATGRAFTLVEILCVVVIVGIAGAVVIPMIGTRDDLKVASTTRTLMADLIYAQNMSITTQNPHYVVFDVAGGKYDVQDSSLTTIMHPIEKSAYTMRFGNSGKSAFRDCVLKSAKFIAGSSGVEYAAIGFDELGTPIVRTSSSTTEAMSSGVVEIKAGQHTLLVEVEPFTGQITVKTP